MSCHVISDTKLFGGAPVFFCGDRGPEIRQKCVFCDACDAKALCDWPTIKQVHVPIIELQVGDAWITQQRGKRGRIGEIVDLDINSRPIGPDQPYASRQFWIVIPGSNSRKLYPYMRYPGDTALSERPGTCDNAVCFRHRRHVGPNRDYCFAHWNSWESEHHLPATIEQRSLAP
jgi:hypothetical protein